MSFHRLLVTAALTGGLAFTAPLAGAGEPAPVPVASVGVASVDVEQVAAIGAGVPLNFTAFGTPGALVSLRIEGGRRVLELQEAEAGVYEGSYLIDGLDAIRPESRVTVTLQKNGAVAYAALDEPLLLARGTVPWNVATAPAVEAAPAPPAGTPVPQAGPTARRPPAVVTPPLAAPPVTIASTTVIERTACGDCAVVESVRAVETAPSGGVIGTIGGAIAGAILGKELGEAHKQRMLTLLGAIGGAVAGRQIERHATQSTQYDVELRLADGTLIRRRYEQAPPFAVGATIRLGTPMRAAPAAPF